MTERDLIKSAVARCAPARALFAASSESARELVLDRIATKFYPDVRGADHLPELRALIALRHWALHTALMLAPSHVARHPSDRRTLNAIGAEARVEAERYMRALRSTSTTAVST
jgi:hypothetical protein